MGRFGDENAPPPLALCALAALLLPAASSAAAMLPDCILAPRVLNATNITLTLAADIDFPTDCHVNYITWQTEEFPDLKPGYPPTIRTITTIKWPVHENFTVRGLRPGVRHEIRAVVVHTSEGDVRTRNTPVTATYTCSDSVPRVENLTAVDIGATYFVLKWNPGERTCPSVRYFIENSFFPSGCPPIHFREPKYTCDTVGGPEDRHEECTFRIDKGILPGKEHKIQVYTVDSTGLCSDPETIYPKAKLIAGLEIGVGAWFLVLAVILTLTGATPFAVAVRRRCAGRDADHGIAFSRLPPRAVNHEAEDRDGYLLYDSEAMPFEKFREQLLA